MGARPYDAKAGAGTTTLEVVIDENEEPRAVREWVSLSGTMVNCAGGVTPGGSWLTCEETSEGTINPSTNLPTGRERPHGYVFEVPAAANGECEAVPLKAMGRFAHEAVAIDPATGIVYLTEDAGTTSGFYRFIPNDTADYTQGGVLQMLKVVGQPNFDTRNVGPAPALLPLAPVQTEWVTITNPDPKLELGEPRTYAQGAALGGARFARLEGAWWGDGSVFFDATSGGRQQAGQIFQYRPGSEQVALIYESPSRQTLDSPDNICVSPRGGIVICEDGQAGQFIRGLTQQGYIFDFVRSLDPVDATEFAGACFSPDGKYLFFNTQGSTEALGTERGGTFAVWGPWALGAL
jgi:secreted PhoX family phosphatase